MLGGGQLGKYALIAANAMGYRTMVLDPDPAAPAAVVANEHLVAEYDDATAIDRLAVECSVVTTEFENPPASTLARLAKSIPVAPSPECVAIAQDRIVEKRFLVEHNIAVGPHVALLADASSAAWESAHLLAATGAVVKTARLGYDGKGQRSITSSDELDLAVRELGGVDCIVEAHLDLLMEISVLVARTSTGQMASWPVAENAHRNGILDVSVVPARISDEVATEATAIARSIATALNYVGVLAVELFVVAGDADDQLLLVNEIAPRPHNSGHWTLDASVTSQFEQQIRTVCGVGLGPTAMTSPAVAMVNLLGDEWFDTAGELVEPNWAAALADPAATLHLYGKTEPRPGRKMGHVTVTAGSPDEAERRALDVRRGLRTC
jgi:5-(carboxyamino)imidazole ribonucleotide synthase